MDGHNFARLIITRIDDVNDESKKRKLFFYCIVKLMFHKAKNIHFVVYFDVIYLFRFYLKEQWGGRNGVCCLFRPIHHKKHKKGL